MLHVTIGYGKHGKALFLFRLKHIICFFILKYRLYFLLFIFFVFYLCGCDLKSTAKNEIIEINPVNAIQLKVNDFNIIPIELKIPDSLVPGNITEIQYDEGYYILFDLELTKTITFLDSLGRFVTQLNKVGKGPNEYSGIECFVFNPQRKELILHEYGVGIKVYNFPDFTLKAYYPKFKTLMSMQRLGVNHYVCIKEAETDTDVIKNSIEVVDTNFSTIRLSPLTFSPLALDISYPSTFSRNENEIYFFQPGKISSLYRLNPQKDELVLRANFGTSQISDEIWSDISLGGQMEQEVINENKAVFFHYTTLYHDTFYSWFKFRSSESIYFAALHKSSGKSQVYSTLAMAHDGIGFPFPKGAYGEYFLGIVEDNESLMKATALMAEFENLTNVLKSANDNLVLLKYSIKSKVYF